jgi:DICT domain-containing protein
METLLRILDEPVPAYTTFGSETETSMAPMEPTAIWPSDTLTQLWPASVVFQMPPPAEPK